MARWTIDISNLSLGGFAPAWYKESYPSYGNDNQAGDMVNIDMTNPGYITQGPGLASLTNGTQAGAVTTLIKSIHDEVVSSDVTYATGGALLHKISSTTVTNSGAWPHTIDKGAVTAEDGEDCATYQGNLYYTYNHSGSVGDIGKYDLNVTFDDDWGSTIPSGAATLTGGVPHPIEVAGNDKMYIGNGRYVTSFDGTTLIQQALDLPTGCVIQDIKWSNERLYITANRPNVSGANKNTASVYLWDGTTSSWETEIKLMGMAGGLHVKNGVVFFWYQDVSSTGGYKLAYVSGSSIVDLANYTGSLPAFYQKTDYKDFILWISSGLVWAYGSGDKDLPVRLFQIADGGYATVGALASPFGTPIVASTESTNYKIAQFSGYDTTCSLKSLLFDTTGETGRSRLNTIVFNFNTLASGASVAWSLVDNQGHTIINSTISYAKATATNADHTLTNATYPLNGKITENLRLQLDYSGGSSTNPVSVRSVRIYGNSDQ